jgi:hypothetical protein
MTLIGRILTTSLNVSEDVGGLAVSFAVLALSSAALAVYI